MRTLKQTLMTIAVTITALQLNAQTPNRCGTMEHHQWLLQNKPGYAKSFQKGEGMMQKWIADQAGKKMMSTAPDTIPVVVHVVYNTPVQNISDAQVMSQIDVLNEDWGRTNADSVNTPAVWQSLAGNMPYRFVLARRDPNGNPTNGIVRVSTGVTAFIDDDAVKFTAQGGDDAWDVTTYLNIWVCPLSGGLLGYAEFPTSAPSNTFGYVCVYDAFGRVGTVSPPYDLGRTTTHEIGHCFNLFHIWADDGGSCSGSDQVNDTPNQADLNFGCLPFPATDACTATSPGIMFMNYMDYTDDNCMNMFTQGQATRMNAALNTFYPTIINSPGVGVFNVNDAGASAVVTPTPSTCNTTFVPVVTIRNWGSAALTSATINYQLDNGAVQTYAWTGSLASLATANVTLSSMNTTLGAHTFTSFTTLPNSVADPNPSNDTVIIAFNVLGAGQAAPIAQSFNAVTFPPTNYNLYNPDGATTWDRNNAGTHSGAGVMYINNYDYAANGEIDELVIPNLDITTLNAPVLKFWVAYQLYTDPTGPQTFSDTLEVLISIDCGATFTSIYKKFNTNLTTTTPTFSTIQFVPTASQWRQELISLQPFSSTNAAIIKFRNITDYENDLYVDDISVEDATAINVNAFENNIEVYPNPGNGIFKLNIRSAETENIRLTITDALGNIVMERQYTAQTLHESLDLSAQAPGIYQMKIESNKGSVCKKLVITD